MAAGQVGEFGVDGCFPGEPVDGQHIVGEIELGGLLAGDGRRAVAGDVQPVVVVKSAVDAIDGDLVADQGRLVGGNPTG